jgi:beta-xylosidase
MLTRRRFVSNSATLSTVLALTPGARFAFGQAGPATYRNPILGGDHPDASPLRVGNDFYLTHSSFDYAPGLIIWRSSDLINWRPVAAALHHFHGGVWAPYLCEYQGHFYIYYPAASELYVVHADHPEGPWSDPIDLGIHAIDPAHIAESGRRYLYMAGGRMAELAPDGLSVKTPPRTILDPWPVPPATRMECVCMEAPKLIEHNGYFYLNVAEGGTGGPATSHMVVSARSRHADGPWEFSPYNPIAHTLSRDERWLSVGHGRLVDTPDGKWYMTVHAYENGYRTLGRQLLLLPIEWTADGWFRVSPGITADSAIPMPVPGTVQQPFTDPSDDFTTPELGLQWGFWREFVGGHAYTVEIDVEVDPGCTAGLVLFYNPEHGTGIQISPDGIFTRATTGSIHSRQEKGATRATLRVVNDRQEIDFYYRLPGKPWVKTQDSAEISGMHHNVLGGFLDVRPAIYASGSGKATFRGFRYWPEVKVPA